MPRTLSAHLVLVNCLLLSLLAGCSDNSPTRVELVDASGTWFGTLAFTQATPDAHCIAEALNALAPPPATEVTFLLIESGASIAGVFTDPRRVFELSGSRSGANLSLAATAAGNCADDVLCADDSVWALCGDTLTIAGAIDGNSFRGTWVEDYTATNKANGETAAISVQGTLDARR